MVTTAQILSDRVLQKTCDDRCVEWAIGLFEMGHDEFPICRLAALFKPYNHFELAAMRDGILALLKRDKITDDDAIVAYATEILRNAFFGLRDEIDAISEVKDLCVARDYLPAIDDFYLLYYAWEDLESADVQWYWPDADSTNIRQIIRGRIGEFVQATA